VFFVGQHMLQYAITGQAASPMPDRISAWAVYDVFTVKDGEQIFLAAVSDAQWKVFCEKLGFVDLLAKTEYATNNDRVRLRSQLLPDLRTRLMHWSAKDLSDLFESAGLPYAPIAKPEDLFDDAHLQATGGLADVRLSDGPRAGQMARAALLPLTMNGQRLGVRQHPPIQGEHTDEVLAALGLSAQEVARLKSQGAVA
jgi:crotonobetainyl-CoA:carnitine CoA-transferase CaiB-like acyl-CoA transferase